MYDFHKTRNSNNENTFYHKLFIKGQKNLLKLIKRKINNNSNQEEDNISIVKNDNNIHSKRGKTLENTYNSVLKNLEEVSKKQSELEIKIESISKENESFIKDNNCLQEEVEEKKSYTKNLESMLFFILEFLVANNSKQLLQINQISSIQQQDKENKLKKVTNLNQFATQLTEEEKTNILNNIISNMGDSFLKEIAEKYFEKTGSTNSLVIQEAKTAVTTPEGNLVIQKPERMQTRKQQQLGFNNYNKPNQGGRYQNLSTTRKHLGIMSSNVNKQLTVPDHTEKKCPIILKNGNAQNPSKTKDEEMFKFRNPMQNSMFEEVNAVSPCVLTSPYMSPSRNHNGNSSNNGSNSNHNNNLQLKKFDSTLSNSTTATHLLQNNMPQSPPPQVMTDNKNMSQMNASSMPACSSDQFFSLNKAEVQGSQ
jgi:hypothetical protein